MGIWEERGRELRFRRRGCWFEKVIGEVNTDEGGYKQKGERVGANTPDHQLQVGNL